MLDDRTHRGSAARAGPSQRSAARRRARGAGRRSCRPAPSAWQAPAPVVAPAGPAPGLAYAGLGVRIVALIIDYILLLIVFLFVSIALGAIFLGTLINGGTAGALIAGVLLAIANLVISAVYFIWAWTKPDLRASLGQRALGLNTLNAADGATLTPPAGRAPVAVPVRLRGLRVGACSRPSARRRSARSDS